MGRIAGARRLNGVSERTNKTNPNTMNAVLTSHQVLVKEELIPRPVPIDVVSQTFILRNRFGLHCRPCAMLVKALKNFGCTVKVECNGGMADGKSIIGLLCLAAGYGSKLRFELRGTDAKAALTVVQSIFDNNFAGAYGGDLLSNNSCRQTGQGRP